MSEYLPSSTPEEQPADKLAYIRDALRDASESRRDDERRGASYLTTGAHADPERYTYTEPDKSQTDTGSENGSLHERATEARANGDQALLAELQADQDQWQLDGAKQGRRRVHVDLSKNPEDMPAFRSDNEPKTDAFIGPAREGALEDAYQVRREESLRVAGERQDFAAWEAQLASSNLDTAAMAVEAFPADHEVITTPEGAVETDTVVLDDEVRIVLARSESAVVEREEITSSESGEQHVIETTMTEEGTDITIDGEPLAEDDLPKLEALNEHIVELINQSRHESEKLVEEAAEVEKPAELAAEETQEAASDKPANRGKGARNFFHAMSANPGVRDHLTRTLGENNISKEQFDEILEKATDADMAEMRKLFNEAGPKSSIWSERPGHSALGRASQHYRGKLTAIITDIIER